MKSYIGLDVSLKRTAICVLDENGCVAWQGIVEPSSGMQSLLSVRAWRHS